VSRDVHLAVTVSTKFEADTTIRCLVIALLLLIRYVTLTFDLFYFGQWSYMAGHVINPPRSLKILCPFMWYKNIAGRFFGLITKHARDRGTDGRMDRQTDRITTPKAALA